MKTPKIDTSGQEAAARANAAAQQAATNLQTNMSKDLRTENLAQVVTGGTAAAADAGDTGTVLKKKQNQGLASSLGINV